MLEDIRKLFIVQCEYKGLKLSIEYDPQELEQEIYSDEKRVKQIIINLVSNALKYTFKGGIKVKVKKRTAVVL